MTAEKAAIIKYLCGTRGWAQHHAAAFCRVNQGRASEVMTGKLFPDVSPADDVPGLSA
jgi:predicted XRE-type DNA-binding protein